jgi:aminoglycoside 6'-N-acetyltransferase
MAGYAFRRMTADDLPLVVRWAASPEAAAWWRDVDAEPPNAVDAQEFQDALDNPNVTPWIVSHTEGEFAYIQDYDPQAWPNHPFGWLPPGSRGIDQFIGVPSLLGHGHGSAFVRAHVDTLFAQGAPAVGTDPHPSNARAIRAYEKAGFTRVRESRSVWGRALLMVRLNPGAR